MSSPEQRPTQDPALTNPDKVEAATCRDSQQRRPQPEPSLGAMTTVLVTGARGNTGREVATQLGARPDVQVRGGSTDPETLAAALPSAALTPVRFDWAAPETWAPALDGVDAVYAARPDVEDSPELIGALIEAAEQVETIVLISEMAAETMAAASWVRRVEEAFAPRLERGTVLRPTWFTQVLTDERFFLGSIRDERSFAMPSAGAAISFIDTRDIAAVAVEALLDRSHQGQIYTLSGPEALTLDEVARTISEVTPEPVAYQQTEVDAAIAELASGGAEPWLIEVVDDLYRRVEAGAFGALDGTVERLTGKPPRSLAAFVAEHAEQWRE